MNEKTYLDWKKDNENLISKTNFIFDFSNETYKRAKENGEKLVNFWWIWLITENDFEIYKKERERLDKEFEQLEKDDDFLFGAIKYELRNHEACYDYNFDVFEFLGIEKNERNFEIYKKAREEYLKSVEY